MPDDLKNIARRLLNAEVSFPEDIPDPPDDQAVETKVRLEDILDGRLPDILFEFDGTAYRANKDWYGDDCKHLVEEYQSVCRAIRGAARTGRSDPAAFDRGLATIETIATVLDRQGRKTRAALAPDVDLEEMLSRRLNKGDVKDLLAEWRSEDYDWFIHLRCASDALDVLRHGVIEIGQSLRPRGNPPRSR